MNLGVEVSSGEMDVIIKKNSSIPTKKMKLYESAEDFKDYVNIKVY